jgi:hypothetical protein
MALFKENDIFGYQEANEIKRLWANDTAPEAPELGEIWLDTTTTPCCLKRYNGSSWDPIENGSFIKKDGDSISGVLTSTTTYDNLILFNNGSSFLTSHDGYGNFNWKAGVDHDHIIIDSDGGAYMTLAHSGSILCGVSNSTVGNAYAHTAYVQVHKTSGIILYGNYDGVTFNNPITVTGQLLMPVNQPTSVQEGSIWLT